MKEERIYILEISKNSSIFSLSSTELLDMKIEIPWDNLPIPAGNFQVIEVSDIFCLDEGFSRTLKVVQI